MMTDTKPLAVVTNLFGHNLMAFEVASTEGYAESFKMAGETLESLGDPFVMSVANYYEDELCAYVVVVVYDLTAG